MRYYLETLKKRLKVLEAKITREKPILTEAQLLPWRSQGEGRVGLPILAFLYMNMDIFVLGRLYPQHTVSLCAMAAG